MSTKGKQKKLNETGKECAPINPKWIEKHIPYAYTDKDFKDLFLFYVINTPCVSLSYCGIGLKEYHWEKNIWKKSALKTCLYDIAGLNTDSTCAFAKSLNEMKSACENAGLTDDFYKEPTQERIAVYKNYGGNEFMSIFYHIRNAFAHGRFAMHNYKNGEDIIFIMEDGAKYKDKFQISARMILKKSTLIKWKEILKSGKLPKAST